MIKITRVLTDAEHKELTEFGMKTEGYFSNDPRLFTPGMAWYTPWCFDPTGERERLGKHVMFKSATKGELGILSVHYWRDWSDKRAPICVVCPNGEWWEIDRKSSNGDGWVVTGELPAISCSPSIVVPGYHGFLGINHLANGAPPVQVAVLDGGLESGRPSVALRLDLPDGRVVIAETTARLFCSAGSAIMARYPDLFKD